MLKSGDKRPFSGNGIKLRKTHFGGLKWVQSFALPQFGAAGRQILNLMPLPFQGKEFIPYPGAYGRNTFSPVRERRVRLKQKPSPEGGDRSFVLSALYWFYSLPRSHDLG